MPTEQIDLVGPKGYTHGWVYHGTGMNVTRGQAVAQGKPGRDSTGFSTPGGSTARNLRPGDRVRASYEGGLAGLKMHDVVAADHSGGRTKLTTRDPETGKTHTENLAHGAQVTMQRSTSKINRDASTAHTRKLTSGNVARQQGRLRNASPSLVANRATASLRGKKASDYQHLAAARLHAAAAKQASSPEMRNHHMAMAKMHRGIANRTPGRGTKASPTRPRPAPSKPAKMTAPSPAPAKPGGYGKLPGGKAATSTAGRQQLLKAGRALPPSKPGGRPGFPIGNAKNWDDAFKAVGRAGSPARKEALRKLLVSTAASVGRSNRIKGSWLAASNTGPALEFAMTFQPVSTPSDLIVSRGEDGTVIIRHRNGGDEIGQLSRTEQGGWVATVGGQQLAPRNHQRTALADIIGTHNRGALTPLHRPSAGTPLQPAPRQTPLMQAYGIEAVRAFATPAAGMSDGPRTTDNDSDDSSGNGLNAKGQAIYKKLKARGFPDARAMAFAKRAQNFGAGK